MPETIARGRIETTAVLVCRDHPRRLKYSGGFMRPGEKGQHPGDLHTLRQNRLGSVSPGKTKTLFTTPHNKPYIIESSFKIFF